MTSSKLFYHRYWLDNHIKMNPFDHRPGDWTDENFDYHIRFFAPYVRGRVMDFGCGDGQFLNRISKRCSSCCGSDVSELAIEMASKRYPNLEFKVMDDSIPFPDNEFDAVCAIDVLEHILDTETVLNEIHRVLKPGGHFLIATSELTRLKTLLITVVAFHRFFYPASPHIRYFTKKNLADLLARKHFKWTAYQKNRTYLGFIPRGQLVVAQAVPPTP